jgi:hypothetical protein
MSNVTHVYAVAWGPRTIDDEGVEDFIDRWMSRFALAVQGNLVPPQQLPLP